MSKEWQDYKKKPRRKDKIWNAKLWAWHSHCYYEHIASVVAYPRWITKSNQKTSAWKRNISGRAGLPL